MRERLAGGGGLGMDFWASRYAAAMETLIELDSPEAEREHREWWAGMHGVIGVAVDMLGYALRRVTELMGMKLVV